MAATRRHDKTREELVEGVSLAIDQRHRIVLEAEDRVVCVRMFGLYFDTNKNFLLPGAMRGIRKLVKVYEDNQGAEILVVGHTDTTADPDYNDPLSLERAAAVAAYLRDDVEYWLGRYGSSVPAVKRWGAAEDQNMIGALPGAPAGGTDRETVLWFQEAHKDRHDLGANPVDGIMGPKSRRALVTEYMALDGTSLPEGVTLTEHGCGESFPRDDVPGEDAANRRVEMFVFRNGIDPSPSGSISSPGSAEYPAWLERTSERHDFSADGTLFEVYLLDANGDPIPGARWKACPLGEQDPAVSGVADDTGVARIRGVLAEGRVCLWWSPPDLEEFHYHQEHDTEYESRDDPDEVRLRNLGYEGDLEEAVREYQLDRGLDPSGRFEDIRSALSDWHDGGSKPEAENPEAQYAADRRRDEEYAEELEESDALIDEDGNEEGPDVPDA